MKEPLRPFYLQIRDDRETVIYEYPLSDDLSPHEWGEIFTRIRDELDLYSAETV